ncbi:MAG: hypothetical protein L0322_22350 [Chloroflexi bacterium]|nr:hypothetical protein [Chloroflexota bacterium]
MVILAVCWPVAIPLNWLAIVLTNLASYFGVYVPGHPRDLIHPFPPGHWHRVRVLS